MEPYSSIDALIAALADPASRTGRAAAFQRQAIAENPGLVHLLRLLERAHPCEQAYFLFERVIFMTHEVRWPLLPFAREALYLRFRFVGLPLSLTTSGCLVASTDHESRAALGDIMRAFANGIRGNVVIQNADAPIDGGSASPPAMVFHNTFSTFDAYLDALRATYRRKLMAVLDKGRDILFKQIERSAFSTVHYDLYLNACRRTRALRILPLEFFRACDAELFEAHDRTGHPLGFVQLQAVDGTLHLLNAGYRMPSPEVSATHSIIHYNLMLFVIRYGIEHDFRRIAFSHTSAEAKSKIGCTPEPKHHYMTASNPLLRPLLRRFYEFFTGGSGIIEHDVFRDRPSLADDMIRS